MISELSSYCSKRPNYRFKTYGTGVRPIRSLIWL